MVSSMRPKIARASSPPPTPLLQRESHCSALGPGDHFPRQWISLPSTSDGPSPYGGRSEHPSHISTVPAGGFSVAKHGGVRKIYVTFHRAPALRKEDDRRDLPFWELDVSVTQPI